MADVTVRLVCGCRVPWDHTQDEPPICAVHNERRVAGVTAPKPRFTVKES